MPDHESNIDDYEHARFSALVRAFEPDARLIDYWPLAGGVSAQTMALLIERPSGTRERFVAREHGQRDLARDPNIARHEYQLLAALRKAGLPVPQPIYVHDTDEHFSQAAIVIEFVEGEVVTDPSTPAQYISEMAHWLARVHDFDLTPADLGFLVASDSGVVPRLGALPGDSRLADQIREALRTSGPVEFTNPPVLLHGDFWPGNLLWNDEHLAAIIDWEDASIGDPILDLARSRLEIHVQFGQLGRERFTSYYQSWRDIDVDKLAYWDLVVALGFARAFRNWGLPDRHVQEMEASLTRFVGEAIEQLDLNHR